MPNDILFIAYVFTFSLMVFVRIAVKMFYEAIAFDVRHCMNVFICGFRGTGVNVAKSLRVTRSNHYRLRGFISDEPRHDRQAYYGVVGYIRMMSDCTNA